MDCTRVIESIIFRLFIKPPKTSLQKIIGRFAQENKDVFFIQIGSNDGVTRDPLNKHVTEHGWRGIVVEPVEYIFEKLVRTYRDHPQIACENTAIASEAGTKEFYRLKENSDGLPEWYDQLGSFNEDIVQSHRHKIDNFDSYLIAEPVQCMTLDALLAKHDVGKIDLFHIDTEGYDYDILKLLNFDRYKPRIILFEHKHLPLPVYREAIQYLKNKGYSLYTEKNDTLAMLHG